MAKKKPFGGKQAKPFGGKETVAEEKAEAKMEKKHGGVKKAMKMAKNK